MRWAKARLASVEGREAELRDARDGQEDRIPPTGPALSKCLQNERKRQCARLHALENSAGVPVCFGRKGRAQAIADGEVPGLCLPRGTARNPNVGWAAEVSAARIGRAGGIWVSMIGSSGEG